MLHGETLHTVHEICCYDGPEVGFLLLFDSGSIGQCCGLASVYVVLGLVIQMK